MILTTLVHQALKDSSLAPMSESFAWPSGPILGLHTETISFASYLKPIHTS